MFVKKPNGDFHWYSTLVLFPYSYGSRIISRARRQFSAEPLHTKVMEGFYIGGWPAGDDQLPEPGCAVLDCICELPKKNHAEYYLNIPVWDTFGFTVEQLDAGSDWALQQRREGRTVYVHCAYGHGRSCTMLCACLTAAGLFPNFVAAFRRIQEVRSRVYINGRQKQPLLEWSQQRGDVLPEDINTNPREKPPELE